ncbi:MAG TPA: SusE domain-containing protein [Flavisolibacter sp.]|nr:SusE domain-containing protein [Flavisolibacter sp.]
MKNVFKKIIFLAVGAVLFASCRKDEQRTVLTQGNTPNLSVSSSTFNLQQANATAYAGTFNWTAADFGYKAAVNYTLQISRKGTNWASATTVELGLGNNLFKSFFVGDLNRELIKIIPTGTTSDVDVRVKAEVGASVPPVYSNVVPIRATPYRDIILYTFPQALNIAGNYQGWNPGTAPQLVSLQNNGEYAGFINFENSSPEFKMVKGNNWGAGDFGGGAGAGGTGNLTNGGSNLSLPNGAGFYYLTANTNSMRWTYYKINTWGVIGSATANGWNSDQDMTYDATTKTWTATLNLTAGEIKFRANDDWAVNLGDNGNDGKPEINGANIPVAAAGNYTITLDILTGGNWAYTIKKN